MTSKRKLKADAAWTAGYLQGLAQAEIITGRPFDPTPWQTHLARVADLARREGYEDGYQVGRETCTHADRGAKIPSSPSQPVAVPQQGSDPERASERENPERWLVTEADYAAAPIGTVAATAAKLAAYEKCKEHGGWHWTGQSMGGCYSNVGMALIPRRVIRWGQG